ncbi:MAG: rbsK [Chitinophagaceae bacterium]|nr:rbsK [Chitinophagaceae bacterium]
MNQPSIIVIGSSNTDMVIKSEHLPVPGETILGGTFFMNAGGKGANQAVAAARLGGNVSFIAKVGNDIFGRQAIRLFKKENIDTSSILKDRGLPSGVALITVDDRAENCIVVASGANAALSPHNLKKFKEKIESAFIVLMQLETPVETIAYAASLAAAKNIQVVLNPAPACALPDALLRQVSIITPNEKEAEMLTGIQVNDISSAEQAAQALYKKGINTVIITRGAKGALLLHENKFFVIESPKAEAIDTTAAGDVFNGALVVAIAEGKEMAAAVRFACKAASLSVTRLGAQASAPYKHEIAASV